MATTTTHKIELLLSSCGVELVLLRDEAELHAAPFATKIAAAELELSIKFAIAEFERAVSRNEKDAAKAGESACCYRLSPPAGAGDWNDYLQAVGLASMRTALDAAICRI